MDQDNIRQNRPSRDDRIVRLFNAVGTRDVETVRALLAENPSLAHGRRRGQWGDRTPLHLAAEHGYREIAEPLIRHGADVMARDEGDNATPLHWASQNGHLEVVRLLVESGAGVNATDDMHERARSDGRWCLARFGRRSRSTSCPGAHGWTSSRRSPWRTRAAYRSWHGRRPGYWRHE